MDVLAGVWTRLDSARPAYAGVLPLAAAAKEAMAQARAGLPVALRVATGVDDGGLGRLLALAAAPGRVLVAAEDYPAVRTVLNGDVHVAGPFPCRLADLLGPRDVWSLGASAARTPEPVGVDSVPNNLVTQSRRFIGRTELLDALVGLLGRGQHVTVVGPAGVGKTALALRAAAQAATRFPGGIWVADLSAEKPAGVGAAAARAAIGDVPIDDPVAQLAALTEPAVLILDTAEHVLAEVEAVLAGLTARAGPLCVVVTSRRRLLDTAAACFDVPALSPSDARALFVERSPGTVDAADADAVASICAQVEGNPLAIELAAARTTMLSPPEIAARLASRPELLSDDARPDRHRTLEATMAWSYELLDDVDRALFRRLSAFPAGCGLDAAESVLPFAPVARADVADGIRRLADSSLVVVERLPAGTRYRLLDLSRAFARGEVERNREHDTLHGRLFRWAEELVGASWPDATPLVPERPNVLAALALDEIPDANAALDIAALVGVLYLMQGPLAEGRRLLHGVIAHADDGSLPAYGRAASIAANLAVVAGDFVEAERLYREALVAHRASGNRRGEGVTLNDMGVFAIRDGRAEDAMELCEMALAIHREANDTVNEGAALANLTALAAQSGDLDRARQWAHEALECDAVADVHVAAWGNLAAAEATLGLVEAARASIDTALRMLNPGLDTVAMQALSVSAGIAAAEGDRSRAAWLRGAVEALSEQFGCTVPPAKDDGGAFTGREYAPRRAAGRDATFADALAVALRERSPEHQEGCEWRVDGLVWQLRFDGSEVHVRDAKGLRYLRHLLARPGVEVHVLDLVAAVEGAVAASTDMGPTLDARARRELEAKLHALAADEADARQRGRTARADALSQESEEIAAFLRRASGLGGRDRLEGSSAERARKAVTNRIRQSISIVGRHHPVLGDHLTACVSTGTTCAYTPPAHTPAWVV